MGMHQRRVKIIQFSLDALQFECQVKTWNLDPGVEDGDRIYTQCPDGVDVEETDDDPTLELELFADWRSSGVSTFLWENSGETVDFVLDHHPDIAGEHVRWTGTVKIKPPPAGGEARATEMSEVTLQIVKLNPIERPS